MSNCHFWSQIVNPYQCLVFLSAAEDQRPRNYVSSCCCYFCIFLHDLCIINSNQRLTPISTYLPAWLNLPIPIYQHLLTYPYLPTSTNLSLPTYVHLPLPIPIYLCRLRSWYRSFTVRIWIKPTEFILNGNNRSKNSAPFNFTTRVVHRASNFPPYGGFDGPKLDRKLIYSKFRPIRVFRDSSEQDLPENPFYSCTFTPNEQVREENIFMLLINVTWNNYL